MKRAAGLLVTNTTSHENMILIQEGDVLKNVTLQQLFEYSQEIPFINNIALVYSNSQKGGNVSNRGQVFSTIENLILASYGDISIDYTIYLGIVNSSNKRAVYGNWYIENNVASCSESTATFTENDSASFTGFIVSPYGEIIGTESW